MQGVWPGRFMGFGVASFLLYPGSALRRFCGAHVIAWLLEYSDLQLVGVSVFACVLGCSLVMDVCVICTRECSRSTPADKQGHCNQSKGNSLSSAGVAFLAFTHIVAARSCW